MLDRYGDVLTITELREVLKIGRNVAYDLLNSGAIPAFRIGRNWRIPKDSVKQYIGCWKS